MNYKPQDKQADELVVDIIDYMNFLREQYGLTVTIHRLELHIDRCWHCLVAYNAHTNPLCMYMKRNQSVFLHCSGDRQEKIIEKAAQGEFFGMCWAGVSEFIFPVRLSDGHTVAFIAVGSYAVDPEKALVRLKSVCSQYELNYQYALSLFDQLSHTPPDIGFLKRVIHPLAHMFTRLTELNCQLNSDPSKRARSGDSDALYAEVERYVLTHYADPDLSLRTICRHFNFSPSYMSHLFNRGGESLKQRINSRRIQMAKILLSRTAMSVQEVALAVGFTDSNYFSTVFRRAAGLSPRAFRQSLSSDPNEGK